ncbi:MAG: hypothetical protein K9G06_01085 [Chitinophagaceae bacterium]|nr:hypothetical protein [Chitinophagaceae bacterium]
MRIIHTLLLAGFLLPTLKDTSQLKPNYYSLTADLKIAPNYYTTKTGFFCITERSVEKRTKLAVKFRLGSVEQTQKLEGYNLSRNTQH